MIAWLRRLWRRPWRGDRVAAEPPPLTEREVRVMGALLWHGPMYGLQVRDRTRLGVGVYPILRGLEARGYLAVRQVKPGPWAEFVRGGRPRGVYDLTDDGRAALVALHPKFDRSAE